MTTIMLLCAQRSWHVLLGKALNPALVATGRHTQTMRMEFNGGAVTKRTRIGFEKIGQVIGPGTELRRTRKLRVRIGGTRTQKSGFGHRLPSCEYACRF